MGREEWFVNNPIIYFIKVQVWMSAMTKGNNKPVIAKKELIIIFLK